MLVTRGKLISAIRNQEHLLIKIEIEKTVTRNTRRKVCITKVHRRLVLVIRAIRKSGEGKQRSQI